MLFVYILVKLRISQCHHGHEPCQIADCNFIITVNTPNGRFTFESGNPTVLSDFACILKRVQEEIWQNKIVGLYVRAWLMKICRSELCFIGHTVVHLRHLRPAS